jgi:hypothetical protein
MRKAIDRVCQGGLWFFANISGTFFCCYVDDLPMVWHGKRVKLSLKEWCLQEKCRLLGSSATRNIVGAVAVF